MASDAVTKVSILGSEIIIAGYDLTASLAADVVESIPASSYVVVTDTNIAPLHLSGLVRALQDELRSKQLSEQRRVLTYVLPPGESVKTREVKAQVEDWMLAKKCTRDSCMIALGGGVIGDMIGFVASTFMRGCPVIQIPTTLLAMVDSSLGGKTAVDTPHGKNLIGAFHQPRRVFIDLKYLQTLPRREFVNGLAEVIKTAAIWSAEDFSLLENHAEEILALSQAKHGDSGAGAAAVRASSSYAMLLKVILGSVKVKAHVVTVDEKETGLRGLLNFGHSVGHAVEAILSPELLHGECVAIGMVKEAEIARNLGHLRDVDVGRLVRCLQGYGLPISTEEKSVKSLAPGKHCPVERLLDIMKVDKKNQGTKKRIVLLSGIGRTLEPKASFVSDDVIRKILSPAAEVEPIEPFDAPSPAPHVSLNVPGSKSISNRALVLAALGEGTCRLKGLLLSDDVHVMLDALQKLVGITFDWEDDGETLVVTGGAGRLAVPSSEIYLGNAGTAARFLTTVCALTKRGVATNAAAATVVTGNARMKQRPIGPLVDALRENGCEIEFLEGKGCLPLSISAGEKGLPGGHIKLSASISSQYVSSILLSAPYAAEPVTLELVGGAVVSQPYIDMTIEMMASFGIKVERVPGTDVYKVPKGIYKNPGVYLIEADASSATYPLAFAAITGRKVTVTNIGSKSLQGDAEFAVKVLKPMGCEVHQTEKETTVQGPTCLAPIPEIDMETMTDAFLTASVLAAVATHGGSNVTRIRGIANQRVKECNRIAAMVEQLAGFGVSASELDDGIQINGIERAKLTAPSKGVKCYDDHRIAMSFSLLASVVPTDKRAVILEKKCVEKTWPAWWDVIESKLGRKIRGVDLPKKEEAEKAQVKSDLAWFLKALSSRPQYHADTLVLIGMRGAGKTHMGKAIAKALSRVFIDMDAYFEQAVGKPIPQFLAESNWDEFRRLEASFLDKVLKEKPTNHVISCGGGIVETEAGREVLERWAKVEAGSKRHVLHISRPIEEIVDYLTVDKTRPIYGEDHVAVWNRRSPHYRALSTAEFRIVRAANESWEAVEADLLRLVRFITKKTPQEPPAFKSRNDSSFFLSLTFPDIRDALNVLDEASTGADALELRVDLLKDTSDDFVAEQVALLRRHSPLPIVYTVRSAGQGGKYPDADVEGMYRLVELGVKLGCEFVDVEISDMDKDLPKTVLIRKVLEHKGNAHVIASYHDVSGTALWNKVGYGSGLDSKSKVVVNMMDKYRELYLYGDTVKLIGRAKRLEDNFALEQFRSLVAQTPNYNAKPLIAINMGRIGQISRAVNTYFTPVTHPKLPVSAAPGQLSIAEIHRFRETLGVINPQQYYLFGSPISQSMSPTLHNTGFKALGLPHEYGLKETSDAKIVKEIVSKGLADGTFGGASVTIPLKEDVIRMDVCQVLSEAASKIGAVNTIVNWQREDGSSVVLGDNTDWLGIQASILARLPYGTVAGYDSIVGAVIGAGGTSRAALFALKQLGATSLRLWNRTPAKAQVLAKEFGAEAVRGGVEEILAKPSRSADAGPRRQLFLVVSTIPGPAQEGFDWKAVFGRAEEASAEGSFGVVVEMAYRPRRTECLLALEKVPKGNVTWKDVEGIEILIEQGFEQFIRWTGRKPPKAEMRKIVYEKY
ncbi:3-dehydroquinate dehydratase (3-dehydroquinase) [Phlyctochytrium bullatum]|nr:3-dehydroquinate dehydratase (3-dehydroquinase) [Phlyctochytrium bullatum]